MPWNGLCPKGRHGLDYQGQPCDLCAKPRRAASRGGRQYVSFEGAVHLMGPLQAEFTLCGVAEDAADSERDESLRFEKTTKRTVSCPQCVRFIEHCRYVKTQEPRP